MPIDCCLFSKPGIQVNDITDIVSHPQPISQCAQYLHQNYPNATLHQASSTTDAVRILEDSPTKKMAVIGHHHLADLYQLQLLTESIQDNPNNVTRFGLISTTPAPKQTKTKTSLICAPKHDQPGSLYNLLSYFNDHNVNLTKITSRPTKTKLGEYMFFIDYDTPDLDHNETLLSNLETQCAYFQHLGSYPQFTLD